MIAAITSCTNTSNPYVMIGAGCAGAKGPRAGPEPRSHGSRHRSRPGSQVVIDLSGDGRPSRRSRRDRLQPRGLWLHDMHRQLRARCQPEISEAIHDNDLVGHVGPVGQPQLRGPRSAPMCAPTISPRRRWSWPMRLPGSMMIDLTTEPLGTDKDGNDVYLKDIWPTQEEIAKLVRGDGDARGVPDEICRCVQRRREMAGRRDDGRPDL